MTTRTLRIALIPIAVVLSRAPGRLSFGPPHPLRHRRSRVGRARQSLPSNGRDGRRGSIAATEGDDEERGGGGGGPILLPSASDPTRFDAACVAHPVVLPPARDGERWQMYYYGHSGAWSGGRTAFLPTGSCGLAESDDGIEWTKVDGPREDGSVLGPSDDADEWDAVQVGVGDVVRVPRREGDEEELHMYYFGGSSEPVSLGAMSGGDGLEGFRIRIGRAKSRDGGRTWEKMGMCLDHDPSEGIFASWPRIIAPTEDGSPWRMLYHAFDGQKWRVFGVKSVDLGATWKRTGLVLEGGASENCFDFNGIGTRSVAAWRGGLLMVYEGVDKKGTHRLGAAFCADPDGGSKWEKIQDLDGCSQPGGPILEPGTDPMGAWTKTVVGTPHLLTMGDGSMRLYFVAKAGEKGHSIGCLVSDNGDVSPKSWRPLQRALSHWSPSQ